MSERVHFIDGPMDGITKVEEAPQPRRITCATLNGVNTLTWDARIDPPSRDLIGWTEHRYDLFGHTPSHTALYVLTDSSPG